MEIKVSVMEANILPLFLRSWSLILDDSAFNDSASIFHTSAVMVPLIL